MARTDTLANYITDLTNAVREMTGETGLIKASELDIKIKNIAVSGGDEAVSSGLHKVETIDEMTAITNPSDGDVCIVYTEPQYKVTPDSKFSQVTLPYEVNGSIGGFQARSATFRNDDGTESISMSIPMLGASVTITIRTPNEQITAKYNRSGTTYIRADSTENETYIFSSELSLKSSSNWTDEMSNFLLIGIGGLEGLYIYQNEEWNYLDIGINTAEAKIISGSKAYTNNGTIIGEFGNWNSREELDTFTNLFNNFDTSRIEDFSYLFNRKAEQRMIKLLPFLDTSSAKDMSFMFNSNTTITSLDVSDLDTSNVTTMYNMFSNCPELVSLDLSNFDTSNVTTMASMFISDYALSSLDISSFNTSNVTTMNSMFASCRSLTSLDLTHFDTSNVTNMFQLIAGCTGLTSIDLHNFNTSNVTSMYRMFAGDTGFTSLDLSSFNTSKVTTMYGMFDACTNLTLIDLRNFDFSAVEEYDYMFRDVPTDCEIIVKDTTAKTWITSKFTDLTNVKTVAELGGA